MTTPEPPATGPLDWYLIEKSARDNPTQGAIVRAAAGIAQHVVESVDKLGLQVSDRDEFWHGVAVDAYAHLRAYDTAITAMGHPSLPVPTRIAEPAGIRTWLTGPAYPGASISMAERLHLDDAFHAGTDFDDLALRLARLVLTAQDDGIVGVDDHEIRILTGADRFAHDDDRLFLNIQPPIGPQLLHGYLAPTEVLGDGRGVDAAVHAVTSIGRLVATVLADHSMLLDSVRGHLDRTPQTATVAPLPFGAFAAPLSQARPSTPAPAAAPESASQPASPTRPRRPR